ncbi:DUF4034 domain-containing protein [Deinococcus multiflagellatus]|nr:DUF4034 domain-containing protein [Deinococcus multiflagellatus]MBZ9714324.1 DUF4034 domain-containing protein [Deinococcus multiflagellatus]
MNAAPDLLRLLRDEQYGTLQEHLGGLQRQFEAGQLAERDLLNAFQAFQQPDPALGERFSAWMDAHVGSYEAHVALAEWLLSRAWAARGEAKSSHVSDQGWRGLEHFTEQATACAGHAVTLTANPLAAWAVIGWAANSLGCRVSAAEVDAQQYPDWFTQGLAANPQSLTLRRIMLYHLREEWGGSEAQMLAFVRHQQASGLLSETDMQRLWAEFHVCVSHHAMAFTRDFVVAVERAQLAANLRDLHANQLFVALTIAGRSLAERRAALERYLAAAEQDEDAALDGNGLIAFVHGWQGLEDLAPRVAGLLRRAAERGDTDAMIGLGKLQLAGPAWRLPDALPWLLRARDEGNREAAELLVVLRADQEPEEVNRDALRAADLGSPDLSWHVYGHFGAFRQQFGLDERDRYRYLLRAADAGNNDARVALAQQLRAGRVEVGGDGVLRPVKTRPIQDSLNYARHLLERAEGSGHAGAQRLLARSKARDWEAGTARRALLWPALPFTLSALPSTLSALPLPTAGQALRPLLALGIMSVVLFRACHQAEPSEPWRQVLTPEQRALVERIESGDARPVFEGDRLRLDDVKPAVP